MSNRKNNETLTEYNERRADELIAQAQHEEACRAEWLRRMKNFYDGNGDYK
jgi:hypothetical protein